MSGHMHAYFQYYREKTVQNALAYVTYGENKDRLFVITILFFS